MHRISLIVLGLLLASSAEAATKTFQLRVSSGDFDRVQTPVCVAIQLPESFAKDASVQLRDEQGQAVAGQLTAPCLLSAAKAPANERQLVFVLPRLKAGTTATYTAEITDRPPTRDAGFAWTDTPGKHAELAVAGRPVLRYMYEPLDDARREATYKVFHHVFDPEGKQLVTKGPGGQFTHHRGLFFGFNRVTYGNGQSADIWHCSRDTHQLHAKFLAQEEGPVLGRHRLAIEWRGNGKQVFATEERELSAFRVPGGQMIEFATRLRSAGGKIKLDGDPQHAGFHFRASNEVAEKNAKQTYFLRPDGAGKPGETRNWPGLKSHVNLPWNAMSFVVGGQRYTACYLDRPENPKEARFSERDYGRFGSYFEFTVDDDRPLELVYRVWLQAGEMTGPQVESLSRDLVQPVRVEVKEG